MTVLTLCDVLLLFPQDVSSEVPRARKALKCESDNTNCCVSDLLPVSDWLTVVCLLVSLRSLFLQERHNFLTLMKDAEDLDRSLLNVPVLRLLWVLLGLVLPLALKLTG